MQRERVPGLHADTMRRSDLVTGLTGDEWQQVRRVTAAKVGPTAVSRPFHAVRDARTLSA